MTVPTLPGAPLPGDTAATFNAKAFAFLGALDAWGAAINSTAASVNSDASTSATQASAASASAAAALASQVTSAANALAAAASAGASPWVSGTTYAIGDKRWSLLNGRVYVRRTAGAGTTDPANDAPNWTDTLGALRIRVTSNTTAQAGCLYELDSTGGSFNVTLPASFTSQDRISFVDVGLSLATNPVTILRNGNSIRRVGEDLICDQNGDSFDLVAQTSLGWIEE